MKFFLVILLYLIFLSFLQFSFLPAIFPLSFIPNLVFIFIIIYAVIENPNKNYALYLAIFGGLINDFMSPGIFIYFLLFFTIIFILKHILKNYVQLSF